MRHLAEPAKRAVATILIGDPDVGGVPLQVVGCAGTGAQARRLSCWGASGSREIGAKSHWPRRGEIYLTALHPTIGREINKLRPALIIHNDVSNRVTDLTIVAPITSTVRFPLNPVHVLLPADSITGLAMTSVALLNQIRAVDKVRLVRRLGALDAEILQRVDEAIQICLGLTQL